MEENGRKNIPQSSIRFEVPVGGKSFGVGGKGKPHGDGVTCKH